MLKYLIDRMKEPSTWSALPGLAIAFGLGVPPGALEALAQVGIGVASLAGVFLKERAK